MISDVVISFDSTGSMNPAISEVRRKVESFITTLFDSVDGLRIGIINHGSYCDGDRLIDIHDLTTDKNSLVNFLRNTRNTAGCDMSHASYEYVFMRAKTLDWQAPSRALIMIGDCEPHPVGYRIDHTRRSTIDWAHEVHQLIDTLNVKIYPIQALNRRQHTHFYNALAKMSSTPKLDLMQFSDVAEYLTAVIYAQNSNEHVEKYAEQLQTEGLFNRNIATMFNTLLGTSQYIPAGNNFSTTRYTGDKSDLREVDPARFQVLHVDSDTPISDFVRATGATFKIGRGFYQLSKSETVQERKEVVLVDKKTGDMWSGTAARDLIGLPYGQRGTVRPTYGFDYDVFIQSTSANRKLMGNTKFLYEAK
jgi:hypothetical protein